ncbi:HNH endonuclease protein [Rhizobium phage RHph_N65]|nr:HNH endonuclease protein [Rhizobium phage RHph_N65]
MRKTDVTNAGFLHAIFVYDDETGRLFWRPRPVEMFVDGVKWSATANANRWNARYAGVEALACINAAGYKHGTVFGVTVDAHRVVWALKTGVWPEREVDHENGDRADNRFGNLRHVTPGENQKNRRKPSNNKSGVIGVYEARGKWAANIRVDSVARYLGAYDNIDAARVARKTAEHALAFHPNHGREA